MLLLLLQPSSTTIHSLNCSSSNACATMRNQYRLNNSSERPELSTAPISSLYDQCCLRHTTPIGVQCTGNKASKFLANDVCTIAPLNRNSRLPQLIPVTAEHRESRVSESMKQPATTDGTLHNESGLVELPMMIGQYGISSPMETGYYATTSKEALHCDNGML